jgi:alkylation response protein AidB-like acyl-CoA dehydrogenase
MDAEEFMSACRELRSAFAEGAAEGERLRQMPSQVVEAVLDADILPAIAPPSLGGHGLPLRAMCEGVRELAKGCPASAWTTAFLMVHVWMLSRFPVEAHRTLFAEGTPTAAAPLAPTGSLHAADGGYVVSGRWEWATAVNHADWCIVHGFDTSVAFGTRFAVVPTADVKIEDVWHTAGMRATGSNVVVVDDVFVPHAMTCSGDDLREAGHAVGDDRLAPLPLLSVLSLVASAPAVGAAESALELYEQRLRERVLAYSLGDRAADQPLAQARLAAVSSDVATMLAGWRSATEALEASDGPDDLLRVRTRLAAAAAVRSSRLILGTIGEGAGASVYASSHPLQRIQRDVETLKGHAVFDWDRTTELAGRVMLGHALGPTDLA